MSFSVNDCTANGAGFVGKGCVGHAELARHVGLRHRTLFDREERLRRSRGRTRR